MSTETFDEVDLKAAELFDKFMDATGQHNFFSKECALIHCDGMIGQLENLCKPEYTSFFHGEMGTGTTIEGYELIEFYKEIKEKIKTL